MAMIATVSRWRLVAALALVLAALVAGSFASNAFASSQRIPSTARKHKKHHAKKHHKQRVVRSTIGPGGDNDSDNHGAPSDGDGGI
jgi:hypothetical protein